ncbi:PIR protein, putative [Plasmodium sp. gorilla clade G1]|nr:PIR protein, putative [Plasmodium sp. gorilla clade G1]
MKMHYPKILLFSLVLNILAHSKYKQYIISQIATTTSRVLSECDINTSIYDTDPDMKTVKENFDRQSSQRFEEYEERMHDKRKKCKEQCDKDIQQIISKDKIQKSLSEKVEKGCLRCGCGLGGVAASVGIIGPIAVNELKKAATVAAIAAAKKAGAAEGAAAGEAMGVKTVISGLETTFGINKLGNGIMEPIIDVTNYTRESLISDFIHMHYERLSCTSLGRVSNNSFCSFMTEQFVVSRESTSMREFIRTGVHKIVTEAKSAAITETANVTTTQTAAFEARNIATVDATYASCQTAIIASTVAILLIVLVMVIIYLILRYRRKQKMNKKDQYTKLLNE